MELEVPVVSKKTCIASMARYSTVRITNGMICAGGVAGEGTCSVNKMLKSIFDKTSNNKTTGRLRRSSDLQERDPAHSHR